MALAYAMHSSIDIEAIAPMRYLPRRIAIGDLSTRRLTSQPSLASSSAAGTTYVVRMAFIKSQLHVDRVQRPRIQKRSPYFLKRASLPFDLHRMSCFRRFDADFPQ